jgi:transposase-like protein
MIKMRNNNMKTAEEKEQIIKRFLNGESAVKIARENNIDRNRIYKWLKKYEKDGFEGLKSNTGKNSKNHPHMGLHLRKPKNKIEELELELLKKDIEIARLKKGYMVKGVGQKKEYVTTFNKNIK